VRRLPVKTIFSDRLIPDLRKTEVAGQEEEIRSRVITRATVTTDDCEYRLTSSASRE
jgi:hypothetical protein